MRKLSERERIDRRQRAALFWAIVAAFVAGTASPALAGPPTAARTSTSAPGLAHPAPIGAPAGPLSAPGA
jgi:hypothetical protein